MGQKASCLYDELEWPKISDENKNMTEFSRVVDFFRTKFATDKNILLESFRLYHHKQQHIQSLLDFVSKIRSISKYCDFPTAFADEALRYSFCCGLYDDE